MVISIPYLSIRIFFPSIISVFVQIHSRYSVKGFGWRDYDIQFRQKKARNPATSFTVVHQELWFCCMHNKYRQSLPQGPIPKINSLECYAFNYRIKCTRKLCQHKHLFFLCSPSYLTWREICPRIIMTHHVLVIHVVLKRKWDLYSLVKSLSSTDCCHISSGGDTLWIRIVRCLNCSKTNFMDSERVGNTLGTSKLLMIMYTYLWMTCHSYGKEFLLD